MTETTEPGRISSTPPCRALIIAGPNGAGKTTFAREFLTGEGDCPTFINADLIAAGLSPFRPEMAAVEASRLMLEHVRRSVARRQDFAIETTLAGRAYLRMIPQWQEAGYWVDLLFLRLPSAELAIERVRQRVAQGGHDIPESDIRRRFDRGLRNFRDKYRYTVDAWQVYDASEWPPVLLEEGVNT
ncbi:MAG TPA: AAA family ATPase [Phycisphaerae bacterium]|nr:AAA family ATPase [Phycisphaerae bacterium]